MAATAAAAETWLFSDPAHGAAMLAWGAERGDLVWARALQTYYDLWESPDPVPDPGGELGWLRLPPEALDGCLANDRRVFELSQSLGDKDRAVFALRQRLRQARSPDRSSAVRIVGRAERDLASAIGPSTGCWRAHCVANASGLVALAFMDRAHAQARLKDARAALSVGLGRVALAQELLRLSDHDAVEQYVRAGAGGLEAPFAIEVMRVLAGEGDLESIDL